MAVLNFDIQPVDLPGGEKAKTVSLSGSIDASTNQVFESQLTNILADGTNKVLLVLTSVKYINSTGLGTIVKCVDHFREKKGDIKLVGTPTKVIALFEMLGLLALFETFPDLESAIASFGGSAAAAAQAEAAPKVQFPLQFKHPRSGLGLSVNAAGRYRDPRSGDYFSVTAAGEIEFYEMKRIRIAEMKLPCDAAFDSCLSAAAQTVAKTVGLPDKVAEAMDQAITNAWILVAKNAKDSGETSTVLIVGDEDRLQVGILNYDNGLNIGPTDPFLNTMRQCVDEVKHLALPTRGHLLVLIKKK